MIQALSSLLTHTDGICGATVGLVTMSTEDMEDTTLGRADGADGTVTVGIGIMEVAFQLDKSWNYSTMVFLEGNM